jgi:archaellum component FlaF (FlaF/FlaG flagellin family)
MLASLLIVLHIVRMTAVNSVQNVEKALGEMKRL